jgi:hypothetical protein
LVQVNDKHAVIDGRPVSHRRVGVDVKRFRECLPTDNPIVCTSLLAESVRTGAARIDGSKAYETRFRVVKQLNRLGITKGCSGSLIE